MINMTHSIGRKIREGLMDFYKKHPDKKPPEVDNLTVYSRWEILYESEVEFINKFVVSSKEEYDFLKKIPGIKRVSINIKLTEEEFLELGNLLPNLESLNIYKDIDVTRLKFKGFNNLKSLGIYNQTKLSYIDVLPLKKLKDLEVINNENLYKIYNLMAIEDLYTLSLYGNDNMDNYDRSLISSIRKIVNADGDCVLDSLMFSPIYQEIGYDEKATDKLNYNMKTNIKWFDHYPMTMTHKKNIEYSMDEYLMVYKKAKSVIDRYIKPGDSDFEKYAIIYTWVKDNIKYDYDAYEKHTHTHAKDGLVSGKLGGSNTSANGLLFGECVCEGYTKTMQLLLDMCEISSYNIHNYAFYDKTKPHSSLGMILNNRSYYSDVTWDSELKEYNYFIMTEEEIKKDHELKNRMSIKNGDPILREEKDRLIKFSRNRILTVDSENQDKLNINEIYPLIIKETSSYKFLDSTLYDFLSGNIKELENNPKTVEEVKKAVIFLNKLTDLKSVEYHLDQDISIKIKQSINRKIIELTNSAQYTIPISMKM